MHKTPFDYFREYWSKTVVCAKQVIFGAEEAIAVFLADLEALFGIYLDNSQAQFAYFGADLRMPIMQAARTQTLLKIRYKGEERMVEPYWLKYQQRRDGVEREYFFAHKLSGGQSEPGIKRFVAEHMESIENTDTPFKPRHQIELSKSGELPEDRYLFDPNKPERAPRQQRRIGTGVSRPRRTRASSYGPTYIYQCGSCGKKFYRKTQSSTMKPHKSKSGFQCYGYAVYIGMKY